MVVFLGKWQNLDIFIARRSKIIILLSLHWRHNELDSVSNNRLIGCLLSRFRRGSKTYALTWAQHIVCRDLFLPEACFGLRELSLPACIHICVCLSVYLSVRLSVRPSVLPSVCLSDCLSLRVSANHVLVRAITYDPFKLVSPNFDQRCETTWLRSLLFWGGDRSWRPVSNLTSKSDFTQFWAWSLSAW